MNFITIRKYLPTIVVSVLLLFTLTYVMDTPGDLNSSLMAIVSFPIELLITLIVQHLPNGSVWGISHEGWNFFPNIFGWLAAATIILVPVVIINHLLVRTHSDQDN